MMNFKNMKNIIEILTGKFREAIMAAYPELAAADLTIDLTQSSNEKFGHYQFNGAMRLAKLAKQNPRQVAEAILKGISADYEGAPEGVPLIAKLEIAGPGFINITLDTRFLSYGTDLMVRSPHLAIDLPAHKQRIVVDFSSPNTAKEMHVGHLRSTIIGDSLARLFEFLGHDVLRLNHVGDWGTAFGMLIAYIKEAFPEVAAGRVTTTLTDLVGWYRDGKKRFDEDPEFKKRAQLEVVALQSGDPEALQSWQLICEISRRAYQEIYDILGVRLQERGESFYNPMLKTVVEELEAKGLITLSDGAKCIFLEGFQNREGEPLPLIVQKSDGGYNYATTDLAALKHRIQVEKADRIIVVTDAGQAQHFQMFIQAAEKAGYLDPKKVRVDHVTFGMVLGPDGKKFKTRSGETERLIDLLTTAVAKAKEILVERRIDLSPEEIDQLATKLGIGAVKYADLSGHRISDYSFSYERMLKFEGNTAAFLMYAYVRVAGIKRKVIADIEKVKKESHILLEHPSEVALGVHLMQFSEALDAVSRDLLPNRLTDYLYLLAEKFNSFFRDCRVEGTSEQSSRLLLCEAVAAVMRQGLEILGLETVEKM
jgi:arginyl-tRNA synthetase